MPVRFKAAAEWLHANLEPLPADKRPEHVESRHMTRLYTGASNAAGRASASTTAKGAAASIAAGRASASTTEGHFVFEDQCALVLTYLCHDFTKDLLLVLNMDDIRHFMRQLLVALQQVHGAGVVHSDVKLQNILFASQADFARGWGLLRCDNQWTCVHV